MKPIRYITARQFQRQFDKEYRRQQHRARQLNLAGTAAILLFGALFTGYGFFLVAAILVMQAGSVEALRFRRAGTHHQTMRTIWRGSTPHDARCRFLLCGWRPLEAA